ncbi:unnamed protein product [Caenorhabditis nigoni]
MHHVARSPYPKWVKDDSQGAGDTVLSEFQLHRLDQRLSVCNIRNRTSKSVKENYGSILEEPAVLCDLRNTRNSCVFSANHRKGIGIHEYDYHEMRCGECPISPVSICNQLRENDKELKTVCCCKSPGCLEFIYRDSEIGWKGTDSGYSCLVASYDSRRQQRWTESFEESQALNDLCYISMNISSFKDLRNGRNRSRIQLEMGYGCPFNTTSGNPQIQVHSNQTHHCCKGIACNQELYRLIYFEWIQNIVMGEEEKEFFRRLRFERDYFRYENIAENPKYTYPKHYSDFHRTFTVVITVTLFFVILLFCSPKNLEQLPPVIFFEKQKMGTREEEGLDDDELVHGEM